MSGMAALDVAALRARFPALRREIAGRRAIFADAPGGTQVPEMVVDAMADYLRRSNANAHGPFATSAETDAVIARARAAAAALLGCDADEAVFGANATSLLFAFSRALGRDWEAGDEVIVTTLDHDANVAPWLHAAQDRGAVVKTLRFREPDCDLQPEDLEALLSTRTRVVALTAASNALGTIVALRPLVERARAAGAVVVVDAVHYAPHGAVDAHGLGCDLLVCSPYKFFGPHLGLCYGRRELLAELRPYKVRPSSDAVPDRCETGTQSFEALAGFTACVGYLAELGGGDAAVPTRRALLQGYAQIVAHETALTQVFLRGAASIPGLRLYGITDPDAAERRTPTFGLTLRSATPIEAARRLGAEGIFCWAGHFYAVGVVDQLGLADRGGLLRLGFAHYHDESDVQRVLDALRALR